MANLCIKTPSSAILVLIFQLLVLRPRPNVGRMRRLPGQRDLRAAAMAAPCVQEISIMGKLVCMRCQHTRLFGNKGSLSAAESLHGVATDTTYWSSLPLS